MSDYFNDNTTKHYLEELTNVRCAFHKHDLSAQVDALWHCGALPPDGTNK